MNRYFIIISQGQCAVEEQQLYVDFLKSSLLKSNLECNLEPLSIPKPSYFCHLSVPRSNRECEWSILPEDFDTDNLFETNVEFAHPECNDSDGFDVGESIFLSQSIHKLADCFPISGSYYVDVLLSYNLICNAELSNHILLVGALSRLHVWHGGLVSIILNSKMDNLNIKDLWRMKAQIVDDVCNYSPLLWRGVIKLPPQRSDIPYKNGGEKWELKLCSQEITESVDLSNKDVNNEREWQLLLPPCLEMLDECALSSIPLYMFSEPALRLNLLNEDDLSKATCTNPLLKYLNNKDDVAIILRLKYKSINKLNVGTNTYTTQLWRKTILSGNTISPDLHIIDPTGHFTFAAVKHDESTLMLFPLQFQNLNTEPLCAAMEHSNKTKEQTMDSCDWPERLYLLHQQIENDKNKQNIMTEIAPALTQINPVYFAAENVGKYFTATGEPSLSVNMEIVQSKNNPATKISHDTYYNTETNEEKQSFNDKLKTNFVVYETASSFSPQPTHQIPIRTSSPVPLPVTRSISSRPGDIFTDKVLNVAGSNSKSSFIQSRKSQNAKMLRSVSFPIHRPTTHSGSSRKLTRVEKLRNIRPTARDELDERHKMKLREAVVYALEKYDIDFEHELFKSCARKLFAVCRPFVNDVVGKGSTSAKLKSIADSHAKQVVDFEVQKASL